MANRLNRVFGMCVVMIGRKVFVVVIEAAISTLALLEFRDAFQQMYAPEIRPQSLCHVNLSVRKLPQQEIAEPHLSTSAYDQIRIRQIPRVQMP